MDRAGLEWCQLCDQLFEIGGYGFKEHILTPHNLHCSDCMLVFTDEAQLQMHKLFHTPPRQEAQGSLEGGAGSGTCSSLGGKEVKETAGDGALIPQPGPAPKKCKIDQEAKEKEEDEKDADETMKKEGVGEKVCALEKEIGATEKVMELEMKTLAEVQVDRNENRREREALDMYYRKRIKEIDEAGRFLKGKENQLKREKEYRNSAAKLVAQKDNLRKVLEEAAAQVVGGATPRARHVKYLVDAIARKAAGLECTICLTEAATPIYGCTEYHLLCGGCKGRVASCPTCKEKFGGEGPRRKRFAEKDAEELEGMRKELKETIG